MDTLGYGLDSYHTHGWTQFWTTLFFTEGLAMVLQNYKSKRYYDVLHLTQFQDEGGSLKQGVTKLSTQEGST